MIESWRNNAPWSNIDFVEQDLILSKLITNLYSHEQIKKSLVFKGGTALHKLFLKSPYRYSEDLDFDQITSEPIGPMLDLIREICKDIFEEKPRYDRHEKMFILRYKYRAETPPNATMKVKIEINTRSSSPHHPLNIIPHKCESTWFSGESQITTYSLEELLASKLKALYQRNKGRDLFDLTVVNSLKPDYKLICGLSNKMFESEGVIMSNEKFRSNLDQKLKNKKFRNDINPLIGNSLNYDIENAMDFVIQHYLHYQ